MSLPARPLNLLVVTNDLLVGGVQRNVVRYFRHFDRERFRLHLATVCEAGPLEAEIRATGARYEPLRAIAGIGPLKTITPQGVLALARRMREWKIDVVQTRLFLGNTIGRAAALLAKVPVIVAAEHSTYFGKTAVQVSIDRWLAKHTNRIVAVSEVVANFTAHQEKLERKKFTVIHNGIDLERFDGNLDGAAAKLEFGIPDGAFVLGSVSRLIEEKAFDRFVALLPAIRARVKSVVFLLVGDGPGRGAIESAAARAGVADAIRFTGERDDVPLLLSAMDLFVLPSRREGLPTAVLEALAAGIPVLTHDLPQFREIITEHRDGAVVDFGDERRAVEVIVALAGDPERRAALARAGRVRAGDFSVGKMVDAYAALYLNLWESKQNQRRSLASDRSE